MALIPIVNEQDEIIGYKERENIEPSDIYRTSGLMIYDGHGKVLLAQRAVTKSHDPGKWGPSVAGTVEKGEMYRDNIIKEAQEELGLVGIEPTEWIKQSRLEGQHKHIGQWFLLRLDSNTTTFQPDPREVQAVKWFTFNELTTAITANPENFLKGIQTLISNEPEYCKVLFGENYNS